MITSKAWKKPVCLRIQIAEEMQQLSSILILKE